MKARGFTVIELMVTLGIFTLLSLVSLPLFNTYLKTTKLRSEARLMATNLRLAQQYAVTEQKIYNLKLVAGPPSAYQIVNSENGQIIKNVVLNQEVKISQLAGFADGIVRFTATGGVIDAGSIALTNSLHETSTLQVKPSGYVEIFE